MTKTPHRIRQLRPAEVDASKYWGAQDAAFDHQLSRLAGNASRSRSSARPVRDQAGRRAGEPRLGRPARRSGRCDGAGRDRGFQGKFDDNFPLVVWQTGSGTRSNMNANEVISNRAIEIMGGEMGSKKPVHPNDHCNMASRRTTPSRPRCMWASPCWRATRCCRVWRSWPARAGAKSAEFKDIIKIGRTHTQDATPLTLGQEFGGYAHQVRKGIERVKACLPDIYELAQAARPSAPA